jgi:hypothetical protein
MRHFHVDPEGTGNYRIVKDNRNARIDDELQTFYLKLVAALSIVMSTIRTLMAIPL